ncbi:hypothetical protein ACPCIR_00805 [Mycobacterium sp. NPDC051198]
MSEQGTHTDEGERPSSRQYSIPVGLMHGLLIASVLCLGWAWLHRNPELALDPDPAAIDSMLWRTTIVVTISAALTLGGYLLGGLNRIRGDWRSKFFAYVSAALVILAVSGLLTLRQDSTKNVFDDARSAQESLTPFDIATLAMWAWWCACLAVMALALVAAAGNGVAPIDRSLWAGPVLAGAVALTVVIIVAVSITATGAQAVANQTAPRIDPATPFTVDGKVSYRVQGAGSTPLPAGLGYVRVIPTPDGKNGYRKANSIEGYDGATGKRRWTYGPVERLTALGATGLGPDSVVLAQAANILIGIDATTGTPLWFKPGETTWDEEKTTGHISRNVIVAVRPTPETSDMPASKAGTMWEALSPRTGAVLWTKTFGYQCYPEAHVAKDYVAARSCDTAPGVVADVYDAHTGAATAPVQLSALGISPEDIGLRKGGLGIDDVTTDAILVTVSIYEPTRIDRRFVVGLAPGATVRQLPEHRDAGFIDSESVALVESRGRGELPALSILDLVTNRTIPVGFTSERIEGDRGFHSVVRVGKQWWTLVPADESAKTMKFFAPLRSIDASGATKDFQSPCPTMSRVPGITVAAGALLVQCGGSEWPAIR